MNNKEKYQRAFSLLHASENCLVEVKTMRKRRVLQISKMSAVCAAVFLMLSLSIVAYAADFAGIRTAVQIWYCGERADAILYYEDNGYVLSWEDEEGRPMKTYQCMVKEKGKEERPATAEELLESMNRPKVEYYDDGSVWVFYEDQKVEITDRFSEDGKCCISLKGSEKIVHLTIRYKDGYKMTESKLLGKDS